MEFENHITRNTFIALFVFLILNLSIIYLFIFNIYKEKFTVKEQPKAVFLSKTQNNDQICPNKCLEKIKEVTESSIVNPQISTVTYQSSSLKEYYIPIGSGSEKSTTWKDVPGLSIYIDTSKYNKIQNAIFEASVTIPLGNQDVSLRLYNSTDDHPVWFSDLFFPTDTKNYLQISQNIYLDSGNKLYKVQMKTQLGATANVEQARVKISAY
jgi:hypothetical protein